MNGLRPTDKVTYRVLKRTTKSVERRCEITFTNVRSPSQATREEMKINEPDLRRCPPGYKSFPFEASCDAYFLQGQDWLSGAGVIQLSFFYTALLSFFFLTYYFFESLFPSFPRSLVLLFSCTLVLLLFVSLFICFLIPFFSLLL